jgi:hypothetical protein
MAIPPGSGPARLPGTGFPGAILPGFNPGQVWIPPTAPVATISTPLQPPPQQFTNFATLIKENVVGVLLFLTMQRHGSPLVGSGLPGQIIPGFGVQTPSGILLVNGSDYTRNGGSITLTIPAPHGSFLTAVVFAKGLQLGGSNPQRNIAPWVFPVAGAYDGVSKAYQVQAGPTITGNCDGKNTLFGVGVNCARMQIFRNGLLQANGVDVANGPTCVVFLPGSVPAPGDILTVLGYPG